MTQRQRLLEAFKSKGEPYVYEIMQPQPNGLGIAQYNARIKELREQGYQIENVEPGHFVYKSDTAQQEDTVTQKMTWDQRGLWLKGKLKEQDIKPIKKEPEEMTNEELHLSKEKAEEVLPTLENKPIYPKALARYEAICDELSIRTKELSNDLPL